MINNVTLMGRITVEPKLRKTNNGTSYIKFPIAVDRGYKNKDGNVPTDFINITAWRGTAEFIEKYFGKGSLIGIEGSIETDNYEDKDGNKRVATNVVARSISFTGEPKKEANNNKPAESTNAQQVEEPPFMGGGDLPF